MSAVVYRMRDAGSNLLYVGVSSSALARFHTHAGQKWWWVQVALIEITHYETRELALMAEAAAIRTEAPRYNVSHNPSKEHWVGIARVEDVPFQPMPTVSVSDVETGVDPDLEVVEEIEINGEVIPVTRGAREALDAFAQKTVTLGNATGEELQIGNTVFEIIKQGKVPNAEFHDSDRVIFSFDGSCLAYDFVPDPDEPGQAMLGTKIALSEAVIAEACGKENVK